MKEVSKEMAEWLFRAGEEIFLLYYDGTEAVPTIVDEIKDHEYIFGVED